MSSDGGSKGQFFVDRAACFDMRRSQKALLQHLRVGLEEFEVLPSNIQYSQAFSRDWPVFDLGPILIKFSGQNKTNVNFLKEFALKADGNRKKLKKELERKEGKQNLIAFAVIAAFTLTMVAWNDAAP